MRRLRVQGLLSNRWADRRRAGLPQAILKSTLFKGPTMTGKKNHGFVYGMMGLIWKQTADFGFPPF